MRPASAEVMIHDRSDRRCRRPGVFATMVSRQARGPPTTPKGADVTMKSVAVALAVVSAFALVACRPGAEPTSADNTTDDGRTTLLCHVANGWVAAGPDGKSEAAKTLAGVIDDIAGNMDESSRAGKVLTAARQLLSDNAQDISEGAAKIKELC
ncbi:hypothetical protein ACWEFJ_09395 [Actinosynnema sp. NPDC004786]